MPGKRDPNKQILTYWLEKGNHAKLKKFAQEQGIPMSDLIEIALKNQCEIWGVDYNEYVESKYSNRTDKDRKDDSDD